MSAPISVGVLPTNIATRLQLGKLVRDFAGGRQEVCGEMKAHASSFQNRTTLLLGRLGLGLPPTHASLACPAAFLVTRTRCFARCDSQVVTQEPGAGVDDAREQCSAVLLAAGQVRRAAPPKRSHLHRRAPCHWRRRDEALTRLCVINADARRIGRVRGQRTGAQGGEHAAPHRGNYQSAWWHDALGAPVSLRSAQPCSPMRTPSPAKQKLT